MNAGHGQKRGRVEERAIASLLTHGTIAGAAEAAGLAESTLLRWLRQDEFRDRYRAARQEAVGVAVAQLQRRAGGAVETLCAIMKDTTLSAATRVTAARTVLELSIKVGEEDLAARVKALEEHQRQ